MDSRADRNEHRHDSGALREKYIRDDGDALLRAYVEGNKPDVSSQRPGTAGGVVFMTLEDETGFVNVVIWESVFQRYAVLAKTVSFLGITGKLQVEDNVVHLVAEELWEPRARLKPASVTSRDFH